MDVVVKVETELVLTVDVTSHGVLVTVDVDVTGLMPR